MVINKLVVGYFHNHTERIYHGVANKKTSFMPYCPEDCPTKLKAKINNTDPYCILYKSQKFLCLVVRLVLWLFW